MPVSLITCGFCICEFTYSLWFTGNHKIRIPRASAVIRYVGSVDTSALHMFSAEAEQENIYLLVSAPILPTGFLHVCAFLSGICP